MAPNPPQPEEQNSIESTREPSGEITGVSLGAVKTVFVESTGDDKMAAMLRDILASGNVINVTGKRDEADAVLKVSVKSSTVRALLVNARGDVLWPANTKGAVYSGSTEAITSKLKTDLFGALTRARNRP